MRTLIPMAGEGRRFAEAGYQEPKPLIDVAGRTMIERVVESLTPAGQSPDVLLISMLHINGYPTLVLDEPTRGAVDTLYQAWRAIEPGPLLVANCDQYLDLGVIDGFLDAAKQHETAILTFNSTNPHHSYARLFGDVVIEIVEKRVISDNALAGVYYFADSELMFRHAERILDDDDRKVNGEFYISAMLQEMVSHGIDMLAFEIGVKHKHMLGTPEELRIFLDKIADGRVKL